MIEFLLGASAMAALCIALFFLKFWLQTRNWFHLLFSASFLLLAIQRVLLASVREAPNEASPSIYMLRVAAYILILIAVGRQNLDRGATR